MKTRSGEYQVKEIGKRFFVIYKFSDGEEMLMSDSYGTSAGAEKRKKSIMNQAGVKMADGGKLQEIYSKGTPKQLWEAWDEEQRKHFLQDHNSDIERIDKKMGFGKIKRTPEQFDNMLNEFAGYRYDELPISIHKSLALHHAMGIYEQGGGIPAWKGPGYKGKKGEHFVIEERGLETGDVETWYLINAKTVELVQAYFDTKKDAEKYAKEKGFVVVKDYEDNSNIKKSEGGRLEWDLDRRGLIVSSNKNNLFEIDSVNDSDSPVGVTYVLLVNGKEQKRGDIPDLKKYAEKISSGGSMGEGGRLPEAKQKLKSQIDKLQSGLDKVKSTAGKAKLQRKIDALQKKFDYKPTLKENLSNYQSKYAMDVPVNISKGIYKRLWEMGIKPKLHTLGKTTSVFVNNQGQLNKAYQVYVDVFGDNALPLSKISRKA